MRQIVNRKSIKALAQKKIKNISSKKIINAKKQDGSNMSKINFQHRNVYDTSSLKQEKFQNEKKTACCVFIEKNRIFLSIKNLDSNSKITLIY